MFKRKILLLLIVILLISSCWLDNQENKINVLTYNWNKIIWFVATWSQSSDKFVRELNKIAKKGINIEINILNYKKIDNLINIKQNYQNPRYYSDYVWKDCIYVPSYVILNKSWVVIDKWCGNFDINNINAKLFSKKEKVVKPKVQTWYNLSTWWNLIGKKVVNKIKTWHNFSTWWNLRNNHKNFFNIWNYSCKFVSRVQTDFYNTPKLWVIKYIWHSWNFLYFNNKTRPVLRRVILNHGTYFSDSFSSKYSHNYIYDDNWNKFVYRWDNEIIIKPWNRKIDTSNMWVIFLQGFYKDWFLFTVKNKSKNFQEQKEKLIYVDLSWDKPKLQTIFDYKYKYIWQLVVSRDKQHYAFGWDRDLILDWKKIKSISWKIDRIKFYWKNNKIAFTYKNWKEVGVYVNWERYFSYKNSSYYSSIYSLTYLEPLDIFAFIVNGEELIIWKGDYIFSLKTNNIWSIFVDNKNKKLYTYYWINTGSPRKNGYKYGYLVIDLANLKRKDYKTFDWMKYIDLSDNWDFWFLEKKGIYINWKLIVPNIGSVVKWFSFGSWSDFYFTKYVEKKHNKQTLSFINNYRCSLDK